MPTLTVTSGSLAGESLTLEREVVVGREGADLTIPDPELSRRHAAFRPADGGVEIEDLGSTNGTFVDGRRIEAPTRVTESATVALGDTEIRVDVDIPAPAPAAAATPPPGGSRLMLRVVTGTTPGTLLPVGAEPFVIGRGEAGTGMLDADPELSRLHARVSRVDEHVVVEDLDSSNGSFVNGHRIAAPTVLGPGDSLYLGTTTLRLVEVKAEDESRAVKAAASAIGRARSAETSLLGKLADLTYRRPRPLLAATAAFFVVAVMLGAPVAGLLPSHPAPDPNVESSLAAEEIEDASGRELGVGLIALVRSGDVDSAATRAKVRSVARTIAADEHVAQVFDYYSTKDEALVSRDGQATYVGAQFKNGDLEDLDVAREDLQKELEKLPGVTVGGSGLAGPTVGETVGKDIGKAEGLAFPLLLLASIFIFRGFVAALLPLFVGIITVFSTFLAMRLVNGAITELSVFALNMVIALGLGLAIDYSLFIVSRYREELQRSQSEREALARTMKTAGRTVIFSALTVAAALGSLIVFPQMFIYSMGIGGALCALIAMTVALVALPALLAVLGPRVNALAPARWRRSTEGTATEERSGFWYRLSQAVMKRPIPIAVGTSLLLILLGTAFFRIEFTGFDSSVLPKDTSVRKVDDALSTEFAVNRGKLINVAVDAPPDAARELQGYAAELREIPDVVEVSEPRQLSQALWTIAVIPRFGVIEDRTLDVVEAIRDRPAPFDVSVAGQAAEFIDQQQSIADHLPLGLSLLAIITVVILFALTGSVILPIKSLLMNLLTVSAAFGLLVLIFQDGRLEGLLAYDSQGGIDATQPLLLFALAFGLSTDYAVFLLTRIKEARDSGMSDRESVAVGLQRTGRIVTAAALLFCIAIGAFATSSIIFIKELGIGTAFAVIIDATIVRALLVPSLMVLLGAWNWWAPRPLRRLHERIGISEA